MFGLDSKGKDIVTGCNPKCNVGFIYFLLKLITVFVDLEPVPYDLVCFFGFIQEGAEYPVVAVVFIGTVEGVW